MSVNNAAPVLEKSDATLLLQAMQQGDESAFDTLFRAWYAPLCHYACSLADGDMDEAEDIVQQVFVKFWEQRAALDVQWSVKAYLYKMVHNRCLNRLRDARIRERYKVHNAEQLERAQEHSPDGETELAERIQKALATLPTECRRVFELSRFEELKYREIADQLGISIKTVETQMGKALRLMRSELADYLVTILLLLWCTSNFVILPGTVHATEQFATYNLGRTVPGRMTNEVYTDMSFVIKRPSKPL